jgi:putative copper resistance protein D
MPAETFFSATTRWIGFVAFAIAAGAAMLDLAVLPRDAPGLARTRRDLRRVSGLAAVVLLLGSALELAWRAHVMAGGGLADGLDALPNVLGRTHFGRLWLLRGAALGLLGGLSLVAWQPARPARVVVLAVVGLTTSLTGHAADRGDLSLAALLDWVHVVASGAWIGGLLGLAGLARRDPAWLDRLGEVPRRFSRLASVCLLGVFLSGSYAVWLHLPAASALWSTAWGRVLALKLVLVVGLVGLAAEMRFRVLPALGPGGPGGTAARTPRASWQRRAAPASRFGRLVAGEAMLGLTIFACTSILVVSEPPMHRPPTHHPASRSRIRSTGRPPTFASGRYTRCVAGSTATLWACGARSVPRASTERPCRAKTDTTPDSEPT